MPGTIGILGEEKHDKLVKDIEDLELHYRQSLAGRFQEMVDDTKLYLGHRKDKRKANEKWRSWSWLGDPARLTDTETQSWLEILTATDPAVQVEGRGTEDQWKARGIERYTDYFLGANSWQYTLEMVLRGLSYQGWKVLKTGWREIKHEPMRRPTKEMRLQFDTAMSEALKTGQVMDPPDPESEPEDFQIWMEATKSLFPTFPDVPTVAPSQVVEYRGPWVYRLSEFELRFDPFVEDWQDQEVIIQRVVKPRAWGEKQVADGKFDASQFEKAARTSADDRRLSQWDQEICGEIGLSWNPDDPIYRNSDEYWEIWRQHDKEAPYLVLLNRSAFVNNSTEWPFWHRRNPFICVRNTPLDRKAFGLSSYHQLRRTFHDRLTFRDLLLDGLLLSVMPVFLKSRNLGIPELQKFLQPGMILESNDPGGLRKGWEAMPGFAELMKVGEMLLNDENAMRGTWENIQGQAATVGRVSATESSGRLNQALVKHKKKSERMEEELSRIFPQSLYNAYQFYGTQDPKLAELRTQIVGEDERDPLPTEFNVDTFGEELATTVKFRGATATINKELQGQQIKDFLFTYSQIVSAGEIPVPIMTPVELRALAKRSYEIIGQKGAPEVFTDEGDAATVKALEAHMIQAETSPLAAQVQKLTVQVQGVLAAMELQKFQPPGGNGQGALPPGEEAPIEGEAAPVEEGAPLEGEVV